MNNLPTSITKRILWRYVNKKIKRSIHHYHVFSVITLLFDEIIRDLVRGKAIKINNFGTLVLKELSPRRYHDVNEKIIKLSDSHKILRFILSPKLKHKICDNLDIEKTFGNDNNGI